MRNENTVNNDTMAYEAPSLEVVGSLLDTTLGEWGVGDADTFVFTIQIWGHEFEGSIPYGVS